MRSEEESMEKSLIHPERLSIILIELEGSIVIASVAVHYHFQSL